MIERTDPATEKLINRLENLRADNIEKVGIATALDAMFAPDIEITYSPQTNRITRCQAVTPDGATALLAWPNGVVGVDVDEVADRRSMNGITVQYAEVE